MKWDYKMDEMNVRRAEGGLKALGQQGWEAFGIQAVGNEVLRVFLRRPIREETALTVEG